MFDWERYLSLWLEEYPDWASFPRVCMGVSKVCSQDLSSRGIPAVLRRKVPKALLRRLLGAKLRRREVICKLGVGLLPYFMGRKHFEVKVGTPRGNPPTSPKETLRELAHGFNRRAEQAWNIGGPLPNPWFWYCPFFVYLSPPGLTPERVDPLTLFHEEEGGAGLETRYFSPGKPPSPTPS